MAILFLPKYGAMLTLKLLSDPSSSLELVCFLFFFFFSFFRCQIWIDRECTEAAVGSCDLGNDSQRVCSHHICSQLLKLLKLLPSKNPEDVRRLWECLTGIIYRKKSSSETPCFLLCALRFKLGKEVEEEEEENSTEYRLQSSVDSDESASTTFRCGQFNAVRATNP